MGRSFRQGMLVGIAAPLAFAAAVLVWVHRYTGRVPFPVSRHGEDALVLRLVPPEEVPSYWLQWKAELEPVLAACRALCSEIKSLCPTCRTDQG